MVLKPVPMTIVMSPEMYEAIRTMSYLERETKSDIVRNAVQDAIDWARHEGKLPPKEPEQATAA